MAEVLRDDITVKAKLAVSPDMDVKASPRCRLIAKAPQGGRHGGSPRLAPIRQAPRLSGHPRPWRAWASTVKSWVVTLPGRWLGFKWLHMRERDTHTD